MSKIENKNDKVVDLNNGSSANNVSIKNMSPKLANMDLEEFIKLQKQFDELVNANEIRLSAKIRDKQIREGKEIINKHTGVVEVNENGEVKKYPDTYIVTLLFQGGSLDYRCSLEMFNELDLNSTYLFKGYLGVIKEFGKDVVSPIFQSYQKVM